MEWFDWIWFHVINCKWSWINRWSHQWYWVWAGTVAGVVFVWDWIVYSLKKKKKNVVTAHNTPDDGKGIPSERASFHYSQFKELHHCFPLVVGTLLSLSLSFSLFPPLLCFTCFFSPIYSSRFISHHLTDYRTEKKVSWITKVTDQFDCL